LHLFVKLLAQQQQLELLELPQFSLVFLLRLLHHFQLLSSILSSLQLSSQLPFSPQLSYPQLLFHLP
jgi:hypothetical protein